MVLSWSLVALTTLLCEKANFAGGSGVKEKQPQNGLRISHNEDEAWCTISANNTFSDTDVPLALVPSGCRRLVLEDGLAARTFLRAMNLGGSRCLPDLDTIDIRNARLGPDYGAELANLISPPMSWRCPPSTLANLWLSGNDLGDEGASKLAEALKHHASLTELVLESNRIGPKGAAALALALARNGVLHDLNLSENPIGYDGAKALADMLDAKRGTRHFIRVSFIGVHGDSAPQGIELHLASEERAHYSGLYKKYFKLHTDVCSRGATTRCNWPSCRLLHATDLFNPAHSDKIRICTELRLQMEAQQAGASSEAFVDFMRSSPMGVLARAMRRQFNSRDNLRMIMPDSNASAGSGMPQGSELKVSDSPNYNEGWICSRGKCYPDNSSPANKPACRFPPHMLQQPFLQETAETSGWSVYSDRKTPLGWHPLVQDTGRGSETDRTTNPGTGVLSFRALCRVDLIRREDGLSVASASSAFVRVHYHAVDRQGEPFGRASVWTEFLHPSTPVACEGTSPFCRNRVSGTALRAAGFRPISRGRYLIDSKFRRPDEGLSNNTAVVEVPCFGRAADSLESSAIAPPSSIFPGVAAVGVNVRIAMVQDDRQKQFSVKALGSC